MSQNGHPSSVKSLVIVILLIVVAVQAYLLWREHPGSGQAPASVQVQGQVVEAPVTPAPPPAAAPGKVQPGKASAVEAVSFQQRKDEVFIAFNKPVGEEESSGDLAAAPFDIDPPVSGQWNWMGPYVLRFKASGKTSFDSAQSYSFTARPERFLPSGETLAGR